MNDGVEHGGQQGISAGHPFHANPPQREHRRVMVHVQKRDLVGQAAKDTGQWGGVPTVSLHTVSHNGS